MYLPTDDAARARALAPCRATAMITASVFQQAINNGIDDAWTHPETLPPRLRERRRPPRRDPGRMSHMMFMGRSLSVEEELRDNEEGRGRDRTPRSAVERDRRQREVLAEVAASSQQVPVLEPPPLGVGGDGPDAEEEDDSDSGVSWPARVRTSTTATSTTSTSTCSTTWSSTTSTSTCSTAWSSSLGPTRPGTWTCCWTPSSPTTIGCCTTSSCSTVGATVTERLETADGESSQHGEDIGVSAMVPTSNSVAPMTVGETETFVAMAGTTTLT